MDIEKAFNSLVHIFLISVLKKFGFGKKIITWIIILLNDQLSCVINGGTTTQYFNLERGICECDPISAYLFITKLEVLFLLIKKHLEIKSIEIFQLFFLYVAYGENTNFFFLIFPLYFRTGQNQKSDVISNSGNRSPESGSSGSL